MNPFICSYGLLQNSSDDLYFITDMEGYFINLNKLSASVFGLTADKNPRIYNFKDYFCDVSDWEGLKSIFDGTKRNTGFDISLKKTDGTLLTGLLHTCFAKHNEEKCRVFLIHDISELIASSFNSTKLNLELLDTNNKLKEAYNTLANQEKMASIGHLSAGVAHEINNPLAFVSSNLKSLKKYTEILTDYRGESDKNTTKEEYDFILEDLTILFRETEEGLKRIADITQSLKRFSRTDEEYKSDNFDLNKAIEDTVIISRNQCPENTKIILDLGDIPLIECFGNEINQVLLNMLINSLQALNELDKNHKGYVKITTSVSDYYVEMIVEDNGPGIDELIEKKIFDPFFTTKDVGQGTGLGLDLCFNIIRNKHKGLIWLDHGQNPTRFIINLPI